jgi:hypothetical protein
MASWHRFDLVDSSYAMGLMAYRTPPMLFYKGFFAVLLGIRSMIDPDDRWNEPFEMIRDGENRFTWTHTAIADHLATQWLAAPIGCH